MAVFAVAALSARMMAEQAAREGFTAVALDLFGDVDTRRAAASWRPIGKPSSLHIDPARTLAALRELAGRAEVAGWVAGSGFEGQPGLLAQGARVLPLIGTAPEAVQRVRDPAQFFAFLSAQGIGHPQVQRTPPAEAAGWLVKDAEGCGGWGVHRLTREGSAALAANQYFQRELTGLPMSATFVANGVDAELLGFNELIVRPVAGRPFVFSGALGPVPVAREVAQQVHVAVRAISAEFELRGLCSLDFMLDAGQVGVLEVNPRPPASMALYAGRPLMHMHLQACMKGDLPAATSAPSGVSGFEIVFARHPAVADERMMQCLSAAGSAHDLPQPGTRFEAGDPVCSLSARAADLAHVKAMLEDRRMRLLRTMETCP
jgi:predicted ATP-grasp superfamily ATP-dependent carboligase